MDYFLNRQDLERRDPRPVKTLKFLDPACGSGHFLLVAFELLVQMYDEERSLASAGAIPKSWSVTEKDVATTILENNLHGIDIDLRSVQLSYLTLYLQLREHQSETGNERSLPSKVNLVAADASLISSAEFVDWYRNRFHETKPHTLEILEGLTKSLANLSEIGSLAQPEEVLKDLIYKERTKITNYDKREDEKFWRQIVEKVVRAFDEYYEDATEQGKTKTQALAHSGSRGFKFISLVSARYDVVATNPPLMGRQNIGGVLKTYIDSPAFVSFRYDLYLMFIARCIHLSTLAGKIAMVTQRSWMFSNTFVKFRRKLLEKYSIQTLAHLGSKAFAEISGEKTSVCLLILGNQPPKYDSTFPAFHLVWPKTPAAKNSLLLTSLKAITPGFLHYTKQKDLLELPNSPVAYWLSTRFVKLMQCDQLLKNCATVCPGTETTNNDRFLRFDWECDLKSSKWAPLAKAGGYRKWYGFDYHRVNWANNGEEIKTLIKTSNKGHSVRIPHEEFYFCPGITLSAMASVLACRSLNNSIFDHSALSIFPNEDEFLSPLMGI